MPFKRETEEDKKATPQIRDSNDKCNLCVCRLVISIQTKRNGQKKNKSNRIHSEKLRII